MSYHTVHGRHRLESESPIVQSPNRPIVVCHVCYASPDFGAVLELRLGGGDFVAQLFSARADTGHFLHHIILGPTNEIDAGHQHPRFGII